MKTYQTKAFNKALNRLTRGDASATLAYGQVMGAIETWKHENKTYLTTTKHGESRIPNCIKYELPSGYRLVTVERESQRFLLFVGSHDDVDEWLGNNTGLRPVANSRGKVELVTASEDRKSAAAARESPLIAFDTKAGSILDVIPNEALEYLGLSKVVSRSLSLISIQKLTEDESLWDWILDQPYANEEQALATIDVIKHVGNDEIDEAITRAELFAEKATAEPAKIASAIAEGKTTDTIADVDCISDEELQKILGSQNYSDWLLYLNPAQSKHVKANHSGPARVLGVSGSGKTCVAVHRAKELAARYPGERILVLVLNEGLRTLIHRLLDELCPDELRRRIRVQRISDYCRLVVERLGDSARFREIDERSGETLEICWDQFTKRPQRQTYAQLLKNLEYKKLDPWGYLHDELTWVRSGIEKLAAKREDYLSVTRDGRGQSINFPRAKAGNFSLRWVFGKPELTKTGFHSNTRHEVLRLLEEYEEYMLAGHLLDDEGIALEAHALAKRIPEDKDLRFRCVIVDECQDCSTIQLGVIAQIPTADEDGLLLVGDPVQKVFPKQQNLPQAGINIMGRGSIFRENYRNTREILEAAFPIVESQRGTSGVPEADILPPEYAKRRGPRPCLIQCKSPDEQTAVLKKLLEQLRATPDPAICVGFPAATERMSRKHYRITKGRYELRENCRIATKSTALAKQFLPIGTEPIDICAFGDSVLDLKGRITVAEFDEMKGFEFSSVVLVNLNDENLFPNWVPKDEHWRIAFQTYVAMTRARDSLWLLTASENASVLEACGEKIDVTPGEEFLDRFGGTSKPELIW
jgi:hypothetical protein